jgi:anti-sigma-K factor RskA
MNTLNEHDIDRIQDYIDGELPDNERREVADKLNRDADWRAEEERLRALLRQVHGLSKSIDPNRELWHGIERRIVDAPADNVVAFSKPTVYAWAAAAVVVVLASVTFAVMNNGQPVSDGLAKIPAVEPQGDSIVSPQTNAVPVQFASTDEAEYDLALAHYQSATEALYVSIEERRDSMEEETWVAVSENLAVIVQAIQDIEVALNEDPSNVELRTMLVAAYQKEVGLLRQAVLL